MQPHTTNPESKPEGFAFFDVDGTLLKFKSMLSFHEFYTQNKFPGCRICNDIYTAFERLRFKWYRWQYVERKILNLKYYQLFKGRKVAEIEKKINTWYQQVNQDRSIFIEPVVEILRQHRIKGIEPVLVSGSFMELLQPIVTELELKYCLATRLEQKNGKYTGKISGLQMIGEGKAKAIKHFLEQWNMDAEACYAYGDHFSDVPMLLMVGNPAVIHGEKDLDQYAQQNNWRVICAADG